MTATTFLDHACTATRMLEKRRQLFEVQEALESQKDEFARKSDAFRRREEALRKKDLQLQESLIKFNKFLQENESKRTRADKRQCDEGRQCEVKDVEIERLKRILEGKMIEEKGLAKQLARNIRHHKFLSSVVDSVQGAPDDFPEVQDILDRYHMLTRTNADLLYRQQKNAAEIEKKRVAFVNFMKDKGNTILNHNNEVASLQKELEMRALNTVGIQNVVDAGIQNMTDKTSDLGQIISAINNILERFENNRRIRKRGRGQKDIGPTEIYAEGLDEEKYSNAGIKLEKIAVYMEDYKGIIHEWKNEEQLSDQT